MRECQLLGWRSRVLFLGFLDCLGHDAAHPLGSVPLHFVGDVGVGVKGEPSAVVAQSAGDRFGVYPLLDRQGSEGVPKLVETENEAILVEMENET